MFVGGDQRVAPVDPDKTEQSIERLDFVSYWPSLEVPKKGVLNSVKRNPVSYHRP